jgi:hypothetical protein
MHDEDSESSTSPAWNDTLAIGLAAAVGLATSHLFAALDAPAPGNGEQAFGWAVYYFVVGPIVGGLFYLVVAGTESSRFFRFAASGLGVYVFVSWFAWPVLIQRPAGAIGEIGASAVAEVRRTELAAREEWVQQLIATRQYGAPGTVPPMLEERPSDAGFAVTVRNLGASEIVMSLARVAVDPAASGGWRGCGYTGYAGDGAEEWVTLGSGESAVFEFEPYCAELFLELDAYLEYRVGNETVPLENSWWTTSAFAAPQGRAEEHGSGTARLPSSYDAREFFGAAAREE